MSDPINTSQLGATVRSGGVAAGAAQRLGGVALSDLTACDREPIHIPGSIQPHGLLLVAAAINLVVFGGAGDVEGRLAADWLGRTLADLLDQDVRARLDAAPDSTTIVLNQVDRMGQTFDATAHRSEGWIVVELEPASPRVMSAADALSALDISATLFERAAGLRELCAQAAVAFRRLTGFDRVMVYRFLDDDAGVVLAEDRDPMLPSFLNHHFPASDIPKQARALYVRNRVRIIPDVTYEPAPLRSASNDLSALDMSDVALRSVSPIHLQYLRNMGVAASASISIVRDGVLWGLIACHNQTPRRLRSDVRLACQALASSLSRQIRAKQEAEHYRERIRLRSLEDAAMAEFNGGESLNTFFASTGEKLCSMLAATGFAAVQGDDLHLSGVCPDPEAVRELAIWVQGRIALEPFSAHNLAALHPPAQAYQDRASGVLATTMSTDQSTVLMWFRPEELEEVNWAGNPHKAVDADPEAVLTPRASFETWSQAIRGRAQPWRLLEIESANRLMRNVFEARQNRRMRELNRKLTATLNDNEQLLRQKDYLLKEVDHRTQNSLQLVSAFLGLQAKTESDGALTRHLEEAQRRVSAVALVHRRLYSDERAETVDLSRYLADLCTELKSSMGGAWANEITTHLAPIIVSADEAVHVGLILTELVINANKYAYAGAPGPISITLEQHGSRFRLIVADNGQGKSGTRQGFGSRMLAAMVQQLSGTFEEASNAPGLRVAVTAPIK
ncbi:histidine kinase dimerization/phosphoacceptor domain -containing protein [Caulobacter sp. S45]|uniref:histidine kinase dimerization/phosphoacceptor domain -containing protein n=1 Tax=Caulobacter sp. S45 TaxID=1641861 RepID=UPI001C204336|nr:histidine kinase dimerization/phosphoacceptor domain -containing protein [Caulobacter sp. S45]